MRTGEIQSVALKRRRRTARQLHTPTSKFIKPQAPEARRRRLQGGAWAWRRPCRPGNRREAAHPDNAAFLDVFQQPEDEPMASHRNEVPHQELKTSRQIFDESMK